MLCSCCFATAASAQTNFLPGYYVNDLGDTTRGFIEYRSRERMGDFIFFKKRETSFPRKLNPENIKLVSINEQNVYESFTYTPPNGEPFAGFFKRVVTGRITLYRYKNNRYFIFKASDSDKLREITKRTKRVGTELIGDDYSGLGMIRSMISDCSSMDEQFLLDHYTGRTGRVDYKFIISTYNKCFPEGSKEIADIVVKSHVDFGIQGTINWGQPDFSQTVTMSKAKFPTYRTITGGALISLFTHHMGDRLRFNVEPSIGAYNGYSSFPNSDGLNDVHIRYTFIRMPAYFRYNLRYGFFVDLGLTSMAVIGQQSSWRIESGNSQYVYTSNGPQYKVKSGLIAGMAGVGEKFYAGRVPVFITLRASSIFRPIKDLTATQPIVRWLDVGVAVQWPGKR